MPDPLQISYGDYTVIRMPDSPTGHDPSATYTVFRADGTSVCCGVAWADVEQMIAQDEEQRGEPHGGTPSGDA